MSLDDMVADLEAFKNKIPNAVKDAVQEALDEGKDHSVGVVHVVTGALRDSIRVENVTEDGGDLVAGGGGVDYAEYEELGTSRREGHPYLTPGMEVAFRSLKDKVKDKIEEAMK